MFQDKELNFRILRHASKAIGNYKRSFFKLPTFSSKFVLRLSGKCINPFLKCILVLRYSKKNRKQEDINYVIPFIKDLEPFNEFINMKESPEDSMKLLNELCWILFYSFQKKLTIIKRAGEKKEFFYVILSGQVTEYCIVFKKEYLILEDYLIYLMKMKLLNEKQILNQCCMLNKDTYDIDPNEIETFCSKISERISYEEVKEEAIRQLNKYGYIINKENKDKIDHISSIKSEESYLKVTLTPNNIKENSGIQKEIFYIAHYEKLSTLNQGRVFGDLSPNKVYNNITYVASEDCHLAYLNKELEMESNTKLFSYINIKMTNIFKDILNNYLLFTNVDRQIFYEKYAKYFIYRKYYKDDKLFVQGSMNEGIYLIAKGEVSLYTSRSLDEIDKLSFAMRNALDNFYDIYSNLREDSEFDTNVQKDFLNNKIYSNPEFIKKYKGKKKISLGLMNNKDILGLNHYYDNNTKINYFTAICETDEVIAYFLPRKALNEILGRERSLVLMASKIIELKARNFIWEIKNFKENYLKDCEKQALFLMNCKNLRNKSLNINNDYIINNILNNNINDGIKNNKNNTSNNNNSVKSNKIKTNEINSFFNNSNNIFDNINNNISNNINNNIQNNIINEYISVKENDNKIKKKNNSLSNRNLIEKKYKNDFLINNNENIIVRINKNTSEVTNDTIITSSNINLPIPSSKLESFNIKKKIFKHTKLIKENKTPGEYNDNYYNKTTKNFHKNLNLNNLKPFTNILALSNKAINSCSTKETINANNLSSKLIKLKIKTKHNEFKKNKGEKSTLKNLNIITPYKMQYPKNNMNMNEIKSESNHTNKKFALSSTNFYKINKIN